MPDFPHDAPGPIRLAVFDMVGTTVQAADEVPWAFTEAFRGAGVTLSETAVAEVRGRSKADAIADLVAQHLPGVSRPEEVAGRIHRSFKEHLRARYEESALAVPGAGHVFDALDRAGVPTVLCTGLDRRTAGVLLRRLGWEGTHVRVLTDDDVKEGRPAPDLIHATMRLASVDDPTAVLAVGDTVADLEAAFRAGVGLSVDVLSGAHTRERLRTRPHSVLLDSVAIFHYSLELKFL
jgi:phosphonatase-like hydrolase